MTNINPSAFGFTAALAAAVLWSLYSAGSFILLIIEVYISGFYGYTDLSNYEWKLELAEFLKRLIFISFTAGSAGWLLISLDNFLKDIFEPKLR